MNILAFAASNNPQSINQQLALYTAALMPQATVHTLALDDFDMPLYSEQREKQLGTPEPVKRFLQLIAKADGLIVSFAEHNGTFTAAFKNLYDWASRTERRIFQHKPALFLSAAPGPGGAKSVLEAAIKAAPYMGANLVSTVSVGNFAQVFCSDYRQITKPELFVELQGAALALTRQINDADKLIAC
ncbi:NADPH-dependent FMN reductase [Rheinheimera fenheensis]|uniref:NADPH-dependent FMN reductase n=1 Tax=Rheinheimera fenheensis TaxID=3152295 RepID=UPI0032615467